MFHSIKKQSVFNSIALAGYLVLAGCADTGSHQSDSLSQLSAAKNQFFMSRPRATEPTELKFDPVEPKGKLKNFISNTSMRVSSSGSFGSEGLSALKKILPKKEHELIYVIDVRQEPHGLVNDRAVTWYAPHNWTNSSANREEALQREKRLLSELTVGSTIADTNVQSIESIASLIRSSGMNYERLSVVQHLRPSDREVDTFIELCRKLPTKAWLHFVDYEGKERAAYFMLMYDVLQNANQNSLESFYAKYRNLYGKEELFSLSVESSLYYRYEKEQLDFLNRFYAYAKKNPQGTSQLWGEYLIQ